MLLNSVIPSAAGVPTWWELLISMFLIKFDEFLERADLAIFDAR
jgi:hypothetical protein